MNVTQVVQVKISGAPRSYTYGYEFNPLEGGRPLAIGERVELPPNQVQEEGSSGVVSALSSDYNGPMKYIVRPMAGGVREDDDALWGGFGEGEYR